MSTILLWILGILEQNLINTSRYKDIIITNKLTSATNPESSTKSKFNLKLNKLLNRFKYGLEHLCGEKYHLFRDQYQTITLLFESFLFYTGLICQQG